MKKRGMLIIGLVMIILVSSTALLFAQVDIPNPTSSFYVGDFANVISSEAENVILSINQNYENTVEKPQIVVVTVPNLGKLDKESYTESLFEKWRIGNSAYDNGILLFLAVEDREIRIEVGYGLEGAITDGLTGEILDANRADFSAGNYSEGLLDVFMQLTQEVNNEYGYDTQKLGVPKQSQSQQERGNGLSPLVRAVGILLILLFIWIDYRFFEGLILGMLLQGLLAAGRGGGGFDDGSSGGGGRSGGGGSGRSF
ncbi:TPM domain-containing protein [Anaerosolibacter sp.]|uniref:TPM domain-containing protein n=1 Tax=Anaerosolibacter sp. TaxID=1872527 RepID=UPI0039EE1879